MPIDNCKNCGKVFPRDMSEHCPDCENLYKMKVHQIYQHIQDYPGVTVKQLSRRFDMKEIEIEAILFTQNMGTSKYLFRSVCAKCKTEIPSLYRAGKFCADCNSEIRQAIRREQEKSEEKAVLERKYSPNRTANDADSKHYGLKHG